MVQENANLDFKMLSLNARSIRSTEKREALLIWLQKQKMDIIFLQETYNTKEVENNWKRQWKGPMFFAHGSNHSCGVLVLVRDSLEFEMKSIITDDNGRYILLNAKVQGSDYILGNTYTPNKTKEQCNFFDYFLNCVPKITYLCSKLCNNETHTSKYTIMNLLYRRNRSAVV